MSAEDKDKAKEAVIIPSEKKESAAKDRFRWEDGDIEDAEVIGSEDSYDVDLVIDETDENQETEQFFPLVIQESKELAHLRPSQRDALQAYLKEIGRYKLLSPEREKELTKILHDTGDVEVAKELVRANLRLVVKIAMDYRHSYSQVLDLIQEGNIGLMKAVSKYDPNMGTKLSYYASWWIKSYILKFILDNFRLVKIGTTAEHKKLFYNLMKEKQRLERLGIRPDQKQIAENLGVSEKSVAVMEKRLGPSGGEFSIDKKVFDDGKSTIADVLSDDSMPIDEEVAHKQEVELMKQHLKGFVEGLRPRDREIFTKRLLSEVPPSLQTLADEYGVSRERIRQIEERLINKLKVYMEEFLR